MSSKWEVASYLPWVLALGSVLVSLCLGVSRLVVGKGAGLSMGVVGHGDRSCLGSSWMGGGLYERVPRGGAGVVASTGVSCAVLAVALRDGGAIGRAWWW